MKNSYQKNAVLVSVHDEAMEDNSKENNKKELATTVFKSIICVLLLLFFIWVYYKWINNIPVKKHYFHAEYLASAQDSLNKFVEFELVDPKILDLDKDYSQSWYDAFPIDNKWNNDFNESHNTYSESCLFSNFSLDYSNNRQKSCANPLRPNSSGQLYNYIGQTLYDEFNDTCKANNININKYSELFFFRHLDNEKRVEEESMEYHYIHSIKPDFFVVLEKNNYSLCDSAREKKLGLNNFNFEKNAINEASLKHSRSGFKNITQSFIIATNDNQSFLKTGVRKVKPAKKIQILTSIFKLEDITRAHYMIKLRSQSIEKISLSMNFVGKIECFDFDLNKSDETRTNPHSKIVVRSNQVKLLRYNKLGTVVKLVKII